MSHWNNNDREESKPSWLNKIQKRLCTRTVRGWEIPLDGSFFAYAATGASSSSTNPNYYTNGVVFTELLVTIPNDPGSSGQSFFTPRSGGPTATGWGQGFTSQSVVNNYPPYFACPFHNDSATAGGMGGAGVSHASFNYFRTATGLTFSNNNLPGMTGASGFQWGVNKYGVSSLGCISGATAYIKVVANDANFIQTIILGLSSGVATNNNGATLYTGITQLNDPSLVPPDVMKTFFGATSTNDGLKSYRYDNIGVLRIAGATANGNRIFSLFASDTTGSAGGGLTAVTTFTISFDRQPGATFGGSQTASINDYIYGSYFKSF